MGKPDRHRRSGARRGVARDFVAWRDRNRSFAGVAGFVLDKYNLTAVGDPDKLTGVRTTGNLFAVLGLQPLLGLVLTAADDAPDAAGVVVLDERVWCARFAAHPGVVGRTIRLNGMPRTVVGVVPADFRFPDKTVALSVPAKFTPDRARAQVGILHVRGRAVEARCAAGAVAGRHDRDRPAARH